MEGNRLTSLPDGAFSGVTRLTKLILNDNTADPVPPTISFVKLAEGEFKAVVPSGAPFRMVLHLTVANGTVDDGATTLTVSAGAVESANSLTVTRIPGTTHAVTVDFADPLPSLPSDHEGYALTRSTDLPLSIITKLNSPPVFNADVNATPTIAENTAAGENIGTAVSATDPDTADGNTDVNPDDVNVNTLTYSLKDASDPTSDDAAFDIDAATGQLKTKAALDYETEPSYTVTVQVSDGEFTPTIDVTITVTDVDEIQPTVTITGPTATQKDKFEVTVTFSEGVTGFTVSDISFTTTLTEGTGNATATLKNATDGDSVYTAEITPPTNAEGSIAIQVLAGVAQDNANLDNTASNTLTVAIDTKSPTVTLTGPSGTQTGEFEITITFTEGVSGFTREDISLTDSTAPATAILKNASDGDSVYTAEVTPTTDGSVVFKVDADVAEDAAGNGNIVSDTLTVTVMLADPVDRPDPIMYVKQDGVVQHNQTVAIKPFELIIKFGQPVTGFEQSDLRLTGSSSANTTITEWEKSSDGKTYTVTVTATGEGSVTFTVPENVTHAADDGEGNVQRKLYVKVDADHDPTAAVSEDETAPHVTTI